MVRKERKIGEVFEIYDGTKLKVTESDTCEGCYFYNPGNYEDCTGAYLYKVTGICSQTRSDGKDVIFAKID